SSPDVRHALDWQVLFGGCGGEGDHSANILFLERRKVFKDFLDLVALCEARQDRPHGHACAFDHRLPTTDSRIAHDELLIIHGRLLSSHIVPSMFPRFTLDCNTCSNIPAFTLSPLASWPMQYLIS